MSTAVDTLEDDVEPFLLRYELIIRTPRGRRLTERGETHLGAAPRPGPQRKLF
jgi:Holliday junction DNA helicase RuvB